MPVENAWSLGGKTMVKHCDFHDKFTEVGLNFHVSRNGSRIFQGYFNAGRIIKCPLIPDILDFESTVGCLEPRWLFAFNAVKPLQLFVSVLGPEKHNG